MGVENMSYRLGAVLLCRVFWLWVLLASIGIAPGKAVLELG